MSASSRTLNLSRTTWAFFAALALLGGLGVWLLFYSTPQGLGLNDDSIAYIAGARSLLNGQGYREIWIVSAGPVTHFPPGFPGALALLGLVTGLDPVRGARLLNGLLLGLNVFLTGWLACRMTGSRPAGLLTAVVFLLTPSFLQVHSNAMSEPLYIFFTLVAFLLLDFYFHKLPFPFPPAHRRSSREASRSKAQEGVGWLLAAGCVIGLAYLTRYAALALLATGVLALVLLHRDWPARLLRSAILIAGALPWIAAWAIRNRLAGGELTNRALGWHPISAENARTGVRAFSGFLVPLDQWRAALLKVDGLFEIALILIALGLLTWVLKAGLRAFFSSGESAQPEALTLLNGLYVFGYLSALAITMTFFDPATRFQLRILAPVLVSLLLLLAAGLSWLAGSGPGRMPALALAALILTVSVLGQRETVHDLLRGGQVYANERWFDAQAIAVLRSLPGDVAIHTNQPGVVYLYVGRAASLLPEGEPGISRLKQEVLAGEAVIALFKSVEMDEALRAYYDELGEGLYAQKYDGDVIYSAPP